MKLQRLPLAERLQRSKDGQAVYPEYIPHVIRSLGKIPVSEYLAGLDAKQQERFQTLAGISCGSFSYQRAALRISRLCMSSPSLAAEAMRILAAPLIRFDDFTREDKAPPLARQPDKNAATTDTLLCCLRAKQRLPLASRLRQAAAEQGEVLWLPVCRLYVTSFFYSMDTLFGGGSTYSDILDVVLSPYLEKYERTPLLTRFIADSRDLPDMEQTQLLYQTLVHPFAQLQKEQERIDQGCMSLPF